MALPKSGTYIPKEAYLFFPKGDDLRAKDGQRMIFDGNTKFDDYELKMIEKFKNHLQKVNTTLDKTMWTDNMILRFLYANGFKNEKTLTSINQYSEWAKNTLPAKLTPNVQNILNSGIIYVHGRDNRFRPIIVFNVFKLDPKKVDIDSVRDTLTYLFEYIINEMMLPGQVENWVFICNVKGMGLGNIASQSVRNLFIYLQDVYKCRLHSIYIINASNSVYVPWNIVKKLLDETTVQKVHFYRSQKIADLYKHTNLAQIEQQFGGTAPNAAQYWPPQLPSNNYFVSAEDSKALVSKQDYINMSSSGQLKNMRLNRSFEEDEGEEDVQPVPEKLLRRTSSQVLLAVSNPDQFLPSIELTDEPNGGLTEPKLRSILSSYKFPPLLKGISRDESSNFSDLCTNEQVPTGCSASTLDSIPEGDFGDRCMSESAISMKPKHEIKTFSVNSLTDITTPKAGH